MNRIETLMPKFSKGQKLIAKYIQTEYGKAAFMTAAKLGETVGVSESTVVRFATEIGYSGYPKMQQAMQEMIRDKLTSFQRIEVSQARIGDGSVIEHVLNSDIDNIKQTIEETSRDDFKNSVSAIAEAKTIYIYALRSSAALASFLGYYLNLIFGNVKVISTADKARLYEELNRINSDDVMIGISFPRYSHHTSTAMKFAMDRNAKVIALTDSMNSPIAQTATYVLLARSDMATIVDSLVAPLSLINALVVATVIEKKEDVVKTFKDLEKIWYNYGVYNKKPDEEISADNNEEGGSDDSY
ncbi:MAG: MurR/RpiR family transcriptional regulator [Acutalibacteraceae bacterium]|nr:MurR/RpiR family transcriptional regulator [Acutalibacteraceae bacterium]